MADSDVIVIGGDVRGAQDALARLKRSTASAVAEVDDLATAFAKAEHEAQGLADTVANVPDVDTDTAELRKAVKLRELEADEIEHQVELLRLVGAEQTKIVAAEKAGLARRKEAAQLSGEQAEITKVRRAQERASATEIGDQQKELARRQKAASEASSKRLTLVKSHWQEIAAGIVAVVAGIQAMDAAMAKTLSQRNVFANLPFQIGEARTATLGLVDDITLSEGVIAAQRLKVVSSEKDYAKLAAAATKLGLSVGRDAASSVRDLTSALGRGSTEVLDNLGINLKAAEAQRIYAASLGITTNALTDEQKAEAFRVVGLQRAIEASEKVKISVTAQEQAWINARQQYDKLIRETLPEATARMGGLWESLEAGTELVADVAPVVLGWLDGVSKGLQPVVAVVGFFGSQLGFIARGLDTVGGALGRTTDRVGEFAGEVGDWISDSIAGDAARWIEDATASTVALAEDGLDRLTESIEEQLPWTADLADAWDEVTDAVLGTDAAVGTLGLQAQVAKLFGSVKQVASEQKASESARLQALKDQVIESEFQVELAEAQGQPARELERLYRAQHQAKIDLLRATGKQAELEAAQRDEQVRQAGRGRGGGRRGPSEADRLKAIAEIRIKARRAEVAGLELVATRRGDIDREAEARAATLHQIAVDELELERRVLELTRTKDSVEKLRNVSRREAIDGEIEILELTRAIATERQAEEDAVAAGEASILIMDREIERLQSLGVATQMLERDRAAAHRAQVEAFGTTQEIAAIEHEAQIAENERRRALEVEIAENKLLVFEQDSELAQARGQQVEELASQRLQLEAEVARAEGNNDKLRESLHKRDVARIKEAADRRKKAASAASSLLSSGQNLLSAVVNVAVKDEKKREKAALRARGVEALARGALETVEAVASFASFNFVQGALHTAAAATAFITGAGMLAGKIPSAGAGGSAGGAGADPRAGAAGGTIEDPRELPSQPTSAEALINARGQGAVADSGDDQAQGGGDVINIGIAISNDTGEMLDDIGGRKRKQGWGT